MVGLAFLPVIPLYYSVKRQLSRGTNYCDKTLLRVKELGMHSVLNLLRCMEHMRNDLAIFLTDEVDKSVS